MNYISHLTAAIDRFSRNENMNSSHVSLYLGLFYLWNFNRFNNPLSVNRSELMSLSKIGAKATYHKCLRELNEMGYIKYCPSHDSNQGSKIYMINFGTTTRTTTKTTSETSGEQAVGQPVGQAVGHPLVPSLNSINITNNSNNKKNTSFYIPSIEEVKEEKANELSKTEVRTESSKSRGTKFNLPNIDEVKNYFLELGSTVEEADKYFNYYSSKGWVVGNKSPMKDWKAAARNWKMNAAKFNAGSEKDSKSSVSRLHVNQNKDYSIPL